MIFNSLKEQHEYTVKQKAAEEKAKKPAPKKATPKPTETED
jgi:hypothetical protein